MELNVITLHKAIEMTVLVVQRICHSSFFCYVAM